MVLPTQTTPPTTFSTHLCYVRHPRSHMCYLAHLRYQVNRHGSCPQLGPVSSVQQLNINCSEVKAMLAFDLRLEGWRTDKKGQFCRAIGVKPWRPLSWWVSAGTPSWQEMWWEGRVKDSSVLKHGLSALRGWSWVWLSSLCLFSEVTCPQLPSMTCC